MFEFALLSPIGSAWSPRRDRGRKLAVRERQKENVLPQILGAWAHSVSNSQCRSEEKNACPPTL